ncbi:MAG: sigma-54-dependent transcriptional regulator [Gammaproteobacteria bacterium]
MAKSKILIVDDEAPIRFALRDFLEQHRYAVCEAKDGREAETVFRAARPDAVIVDYRLPDMNALELMPRLKDVDAGVPLVVLTGHGSIDLAVQAIKQGAEQFLTKPIELPALGVILERLLENRRNRQKQLAGETRQARESVDPFIGDSPAIRELKEQALKIAAAERPILLHGETGTGKGVLAKWLHTNGPRADETFVDLNCAGLSHEFLETELFGHKKGAFTGAVADKTGMLEVAQRGTVFLDEIGDMGAQVQPKLLKVLEEKRFRRLGEVEDRHVDISLIAATHQDLQHLVREQRFRSDLYFRISTIPLTVPALRQRREDISIIADALLARLAAELGRNNLRLSPDAEQTLQAYPWPGNIRELRNVLERATLLSNSDTLKRRDLRFEETAWSDANMPDLDLTLLEVERLHIERVLGAEQGHVDRAAARLGIPRSSLYQKIKRYGIAASKP